MSHCIDISNNATPPPPQPPKDNFVNKFWKEKCKGSKKKNDLRAHRCSM